MIFIILRIYCIIIDFHVYYSHVKHVCRCWSTDLVLPLLVEDWKRKDCFRDLQHHMPLPKLDSLIPMSLLLPAQMADSDVALFSCLRRNQLRLLRTPFQLLQLVLLCMAAPDPAGET